MLDWRGVRVGLIGLAEEDWITTLASVNPEEVEYRDFVAEGSRLAASLRVGRHALLSTLQRLSAACSVSSVPAASSSSIQLQVANSSVNTSSSPAHGYKLEIRVHYAGARGGSGDRPDAHAKAQ